MALDNFHPAVRGWFDTHFASPTEVQCRAWPAIGQRNHTLIAAPTGSGKTLAAFLSAINDLVCEGLAQGLSSETHVLYVSPLKALSNDIQKNLQFPLQGIRDELLMQGLPDVDVRAWVRTGDTPQAERERMRRQPPHIAVTTPESMFILLTSESGRRMLSTVRTVIVDEIHALAGNKRGSHLTLSLQRLDALCREHGRQAPVRIGLSATQKPIEVMAGFLVGGEGGGCSIVDTGHTRERDLAIEVPDSPLEPVMANEVWGEIYDRLAGLVEQHRTTLIFVNTRRLAERAARHLAERIGEENVTAHHGSLAKEHRLAAEQRLKAGELRALVATASLELGIDIGDVDLVCQLGSPHWIATFLQRVGRSGHAVDGTPRGRLFPLSLDDLVECTAMLDAVARGELDRILLPEKPMDVLAQQIVAEVSCREWGEQELFDELRRAWPYREMKREEFVDVVRMLAEGYTTRRGRRGAYLYRDAVNGRLRARRGARLTALTNAGAIPDQFDYDVILAPEGLRVGTLNEDFAFESLPGDIFQLGNTSYRMLKIEQGKVYAEDAKGQPPNIPFWFGEAPGRSDELSLAVSRLRTAVSRQLECGDSAALAQWLRDKTGLPAAAAQQLADYLAAAKAALSVLPTQDTVVLERFFDEAGDMHLVVHSPFGSRVNRAWGLALRKRFCRTFNFELQAAALEDSLVLSLGPTHSFALEEVAHYLKSATVRNILIQAMLAAPMFPTRWRWNANISLAVRRNRNGKRVPPQFQRSDAEDLMAVVFPDQLACLENIAGDREVPEHPLVDQTVRDCLYEAMDIEGLERLLRRMESGEVQIVARDLTSPSPLAQEILTARPYAFLDDAPAEERRTQAVQARRFLDPQDASELGRLDAAAVTRVREEAWPDARTPDELHDALILLGFMTEAEGQRGPLGTQTAAPDGAARLGIGWQHLFEALAADQRATVLETPRGVRLWVAAERLAELQLLFPDVCPAPAIAPVRERHTVADADAALVEIVRSRLEGLGPVSVEQLAAPIGLAESRIDAALLALQQEGFVLQGNFTGGASHEWCERRLLARIHRYTLKRLRAEIEPVSARDFMRFLFHWQRLGSERGEGSDALLAVVQQLEGFAIPAQSWERDILPARVRGYLASMLDALCTSGRVVWMRAGARKASGGEARRAAPVRSTPVTLLDRANLAYWRAQFTSSDSGDIKLSANAQRVREVLQQHGASFFEELTADTGLLRTQVEQALGELVAQGMVTADAFRGLRALITPANRRPRLSSRRVRTGSGAAGVDDAGRWALTAARRKQAPRAESENDPGGVELVALTLLRRYGVVFRKLLEREVAAPPWRELLYVFHRMEARGEVRGGRFVQGFSGEQFALPEAVAAMREVRKRELHGDMISICAADPLNLVGIVTPGARVPALAGNRVLFRDGVPVAVQIAGDIRLLEGVDAAAEWEIRNRLIRQASPATYLPGPSGAS